MEVCTYIVWGFKVVVVYSVAGEGVSVVGLLQTSIGVYIFVVTCRIRLLALMWWNGTGIARDGM